MKKKETTFEGKVKEDLDTLQDKGLLWHRKIQQVSIRGVPDRLVCLKGGIFMALECKKSNKENPDSLQLYNLKKIRSLGGFALVIFPENWKDVYRKIRILVGDK